MKKIYLSAALLSSFLLTSACTNNNPVEKSNNLKKASDHTSKVEQISLNDSFYKKLNDVKIEHIHGIGYVGNIKGLTIATHSGLNIYSDGKWYTTSKNLNDYMGFQATSDGFYSSGHPDPKSNLKNPFGIVRSLDGNKTLEKIGFYGETDFHNLSVGYNSKAIFLYNEEKNSKLGTGFYFSNDLGKSWKNVKGSGLPDTLTSFSIHPDDPNEIAMNSQEGIYYSTNGGESFSRITPTLNITSSVLLKDSIIYSYIKDNQSYLEELDFSSKNTRSIPIPYLNAKNMIMYIAIDQKNSNNISIATMESNVYSSNNFGKEWLEIVKH
ncbi:F510_1955 family glycosylhydrolase [Gottfriedia acidiceleris]|uniref:F510_1955 family glycosylhydrolase n=1 Tax=Gottfriedia acidiceleris TaxID=371036 RepID=UPI00101D904F|nr:VPS10, VPS10 domain protein [Gottfriedia acidiceleris]